MNKDRLRQLNNKSASPAPVAYWMSRDQRTSDNWALLHAQQIALQTKQPLAVIFCLVDNFLSATIRQYDFMLKGLEQLKLQLDKKNIPFYLLTGQPKTLIPQFAAKHKLGLIVTDFDPLRIKTTWKKTIAKSLDMTWK